MSVGDRYEARAYAEGRSCGHKHRSWDAASRCAYQNHKRDAKAGRAVAWGIKVLREVC